MSSSIPCVRPLPVQPARIVPPLLPVWLPLILTAIISGAVLAWIFPPAGPEGVPSAPRFTDITESAGLTFVHHSGAAPGESPTTLGAGAVFFDFDGDGDMDLFLVNGTVWPWEETFAKRASRGGCALFRNDGSGRFTDVSAFAEVNIEFQGMAAAAGDFDNDGLPDLFVTGVGANHLFRNRGHGRFEDVTERAGVGGDANVWSTGAAWIDADGDGMLDLVVCHYARWPVEVGLAGAFSTALMGRSYGVPTGFVSAPPSVYLNNGDGRFTLAPGAAGLRAFDPQTGRPVGGALAVSPIDANGDGLLDLLFAYHTNEDVLFLNQGGGLFAPWTPAAADRREGASAGLVSANPLSLLQTGGADERFQIFRSAGAIDGVDVAGQGLRLAAKLGVALLDYDRDGRLDLFMGGGYIEPDVNRFEAGREFAGAPRLYWNQPGGTWALAPDISESALGRSIAARGVATADIDGDGDLDVLITQHGGAPLLLRNDQRLDLPWLAIDLAATRTAREAGGARVEVHTPRRLHVQTMAPAMGFMAQSASTLYFGLGDDARVRKIVVQWPSGFRQELRPDGVNRRIEIREE